MRRMSAQGTDAGYVVSTTKAVLACDGTNSRNECLYRYTENKITQNVEIFKVHAVKTVTPSETKRNTALAQVAEFLLNICR